MGEEIEEDRVKVCEFGVLDFVIKGVGSVEIFICLNNLLVLFNVQESFDFGCEVMVYDLLSGLFMWKFIELQIVQSLLYLLRYGVEISVMVFGFDVFVGLGE